MELFRIRMGDIHLPELLQKGGPTDVQRNPMFSFLGDVPKAHFGFRDINLAFFRLVK